MVRKTKDSLTEAQKNRILTPYEKETIITFNKEEKHAVIFTYEKTWQKHLEIRFNLTPVIDNGYGGKEYHLPKNRIKMPRVLSPRKKKPNNSLTAKNK